jgi:hypothetical protein
MAVLVSLSMLIFCAFSNALQAFLDPRNSHCLVLYLFRGIRRSRILADPRCLLLHSVCAHFAPANPVRHTLNKGFTSYFLLKRRHMIKYKYIPFDIGRKTRYGGSR